MQALELKIPPLILVLLFALAMWVIVPLTPPWLRWHTLSVFLVAGFVSAGIVVALMGVLAFLRADTTVDPRVPQQSSSLVIRGIYRYSRNPIYLGFLLLLMAWGCYLQSALALLLLPVFVLYMNRFQIIPEERHLQQKFGADYQAYLTQVRRWM
ncbi:isoprenylcysteine carboxylmethyltransferase family protein [Rheinheimera sp. UJ51]|uniref:methyltransferase family protein n=1 Tax=Rheinheimera sp. UJ51 TaxID=2892446 RepID=UPI001E3DD2AB|nr:isoprenylcysteine carboxylmethyltransferase family protein [Rheinheimera sp. UJ51]MCC5452382.1 isoprenylcysteine carboxylmethyltransferase family protein [Rheinheimera sp. UJ51]